MMKKAELLAIIIVIMIFSVIRTSPALGEDVTLTFCEDPWPPYTIGEAGKSPTGGIAIEYFEYVFNQIEDLSTNVKLYPWKRCLNLVKNGCVDGVLLALYSDERAEYMKYSIPYYESRVVFFYSLEKYPKKLEVDLDQVWSEYSIGHVAGFTFGSKYEQAVKDGVSFDTAYTPELCLRKLDGQRFDLYLENESAGKTAIEASEYKNKIGMAVPALDTKEYHLALSKRSSALSFLPKINAVLEATIKDGTRDRFFGNTD